MLSLLTSLSLFSQPAELDTTSLATIYATLENNESIYIHGHNIRKEIKKTRREVLTRDVTGHYATVVRFSNPSSEIPLTAISNKDWEAVANPEGLYTWFEEFQSINGPGYRCKSGVRVYTVSVRHMQFEIRDNTCEWDAIGQLEQVYDGEQHYVMTDSKETNPVASRN